MVTAMRSWLGLAGPLIASVRRHKILSSCAKTRPIALRGLTVAALQQAAEPLTACDLACSDHSYRRRDELVAQSLVRPFFMIVICKFANGSAEVAFADEHQSIQALGLDRLDKPFGERVQVRTPRRQDQWLHTTVPQPLPKGRGVERVSVQDDVLNAAQEAVAGVG